VILPDYQRVWLLGASTGIGAALAQALSAPQRTLYFSARNKAALDALAAQCQGAVEVLPMDMTKPDDVAQTLAQLDAPSGLDLVILNAGTCEYMDTRNLDMAMLKRVMDTNFFSLAELFNPVLELLRKAQRAGQQAPKLVVMSSSVTYQALPRAHAYGASKAALRYFTECVKADVQGEGIDVRVVSPGFVDTPLTAQNDFDMPFMIDAQQAATLILKGLEGRAFDIAFPKRFTCMLKLLAMLPDSLRFNLLGRMSRHS